MRLFAMAAALALAGCEVIEYPIDPGDPGGLGAALQPLEVGTRWTYETSDADGSDREVKEVAVIAVEALDGHEAAVLESVRGALRTRVWLADVDGKILRLREESWQGETLLDRRAFSPGSLRTPAGLGSLRVGDELDGTYVEKALAPDGDRVVAERRRTPRYRVEAVDAEVVTPAGTFFALELRRLGDDGEDGKVVWYAPGVGKVREEGGRIEVLRSWSAPSR